MEPRYDGLYTENAIYEWIRMKGEAVSWYPLVWHKGRFPGFDFVTWLVLHQRFMTNDTVLKMGITYDPMCAFCSRHDETHSRLFFPCNFTSYLCKQSCNFEGVGGKRLGSILS